MRDLFGREMRAPGDFSRAGRVALVRDAARALLEGRDVPTESALFLGGALTAWLRQGGDLARDFLRVAAPRGSHHRPEVIAAALIADERQADDSSLP